VSLYGTGRGEGITAALLIAAIVVAVRALGCWLANAPIGEDELQAAALPALGGLLCYRFLRAQGRSRYGAFLAGAAYGLAPWLTAIAPDPREQLAAVLAPLALEAACHCDRPNRRDAWLPRAWLCFAAPLTAGVTVVGIVASALALAVLVRTVLCGDRDDERPPARGIALAVAASVLAAVNIAWIDPFAPWVGDTGPIATERVLSAHRPAEPGIDLPALLRVPGPALLSLAVLGLMRRQRHVRARTWCAFAVLGALPTLAATVPVLRGALATWADPAVVAAGSWWLTLIAITVLAAAGLDDFLELPLRRRRALPWLLAAAVAGAPLLPALGARVPEREWPLTATLVAMPLLLSVWRRLGFLRFKNWLAAVVLLTLSIPLLQVEPVPPRLPSVPPGAPIGEIALPLAPAWNAPWRGPWWRYVGLCGAAVIGCVLAASAWRRSRHASTRPTAANAAIVRKARPSQR
jgi:hypothetical protein